MTKHIRNTPSASKQDWSTPQYIYDALNAEYSFTIDLAASSYNAKHPVYVDEATDLFSLKGRLQGHRGFLNPPFAHIPEFLAFCRDEMANGLLSVCVVPASVNSKWFHEIANSHGVVDFFVGRISYDDVTPPDVELERLLPALRETPRKVAPKVSPLVAELVDFKKGVYLGPVSKYNQVREAFDILKQYGVVVGATRAEIKSSGASFDSMVVTFDPALGGGRWAIRSRSGKTGRLL